MKIKYEFADGTKTEVEVSEEIGAVIIDSRKAEHAQDERHRYHCYSLDAIDYEGLEYAEKEVTDDFPEEKKEKVRAAFAKLTATQKRRILMLAKGASIHEIARKENVDFKSVWQSVEGARKIFLKYF